MSIHAKASRSSRVTTVSLGTSPRSVVMTRAPGTSAVARPKAFAYASFPRKYRPLRKLNTSPSGAPLVASRRASANSAFGLSRTFARRPSQRAGERRNACFKTCPARSLDPTSVALTATIYNFDIQLSDVDRGVYETLSIRAARQPSETEEYLATRVLAYCLEYTEGIAFTKGLAEPDVPAVEVRDLTGALKSWIEVGTPDADRLHKASKASPRVAVYTFKDPLNLARQFEGTRIHRVEALELYAFDPGFIAEFVARLERRTAFDLAVTERHLYLTIAGDTLASELKLVAQPERRPT